MYQTVSMCMDYSANKYSYSFEDKIDLKQIIISPLVYKNILAQLVINYIPIELWVKANNNHKFISVHKYISVTGDQFLFYNVQLSYDTFTAGMVKWKLRCCNYLMGYIVTMAVQLMVHIW